MKIDWLPRVLEITMDWMPSRPSKSAMALGFSVIFLIYAPKESDPILYNMALSIAMALGFIGTIDLSIQIVHGWFRR